MSLRLGLANWVALIVVTGVVVAGLIYFIWIK
jgi:hypothetical protein